MPDFWLKSGFPIDWSGNTQGGPWYHTTVEPLNGRFVSKIGFWHNHINLRGVRAITNDGAYHGHGEANGSLEEISLSQDETITRATIGLYRIRDRVLPSSVSFETSRGQSLKAGKPNPSEEFSLDVGSGHLLAYHAISLMGGSGEDMVLNGLHALEFMFLRPITKVDISNVRFDSVPPINQIVPATLYQTLFENFEDTPTTWVFANSIKKTDTTFWEISAFIRFGMHASVTAGIFKIVSVTGGYEWEIGADFTWQQTTSTTMDHNWSLSGTLQPGTSTMATATCQTGTANIGFQSTVTAWVDNGAIFQYEDPGILRNTQYTNTTASSRPVPRPADSSISNPAPSGNSEPEASSKGKLVVTEGFEAVVRTIGLI